MNAEEYLRHRAQENVDLGKNRQVINLEEAREKADANNFLSEVRSDLRINSIYYPVCSQDAVLEPVFTGKVTYLDSSILRHDAGKKGIIGDFTNPPIEIADASFDAAFIKDIHLHLTDDGQISPEQKLNAILRKVKPGGNIIYGVRRACDKWEAELEFINSQSSLVPLQLGYTHPDFKVFVIGN